MSVTETLVLRRQAFVQDPSYANVHPEGYAVGYLRQTGDATGGSVIAFFDSDPGFIYRLESVRHRRQDAVASVVEFLINDWWLVKGLDYVDQAASIFDVLMAETVMSLGHDYTLSVTARDTFRRVPVQTTIQQPTICSIANRTNTNAAIYHSRVIFSYWRKDTLTKPGFMSGFLEAPFPPRPPPRA